MIHKWTTTQAAFRGIKVYSSSWRQWKAHLNWRGKGENRVRVQKQSLPFNANNAADSVSAWITDYSLAASFRRVIHSLNTNPTVSSCCLEQSVFQWCHLLVQAAMSAYLCCSQVRTSLPDTSCFHCSRMCNARRTHPWADKTCCSQSRSSAHHSWPWSGIQTGLLGRCESASAIAGWGWSCRSERLSLSTSHLYLNNKFNTINTATFFFFFLKIEFQSVFIECFEPGGE